MKRFLASLIAACFLFGTGAAATEPQGPTMGQALPDFSLTVPDNSEFRIYLGVEGKTAFSITDIQSEMVIIEIFSMYCPFCQREAPSMNRFFEMVNADPSLKNKIKLIGIGAGNSTAEVEVFHKKYQVPFPLFEDGDFSIHKKIGEVRTPYFIGVRKNTDRTHTVFFSKLGGFESPEKFLNQLLQAAGIRKGGTP